MREQSDDAIDTSGGRRGGIGDINEDAPAQDVGERLPLGVGEVVFELHAAGVRAGGLELAGEGFTLRDGVEQLDGNKLEGGKAVIDQAGRAGLAIDRIPLQRGIGGGLVIKEAKRINAGLLDDEVLDGGIGRIGDGAAAIVTHNNRRGER